MPEVPKTGLALVAPALAAAASAGAGSPPANNAAASMVNLLKGLVAAKTSATAAVPAAANAASAASATSASSLPALVKAAAAALQRPSAAATAAAPATDAANELKLVEEFIKRWQLEPIRTKSMLAGLAPTQRRLLITNFKAHSPGVSAMNALIDQVRQTPKANSVTSIRVPQAAPAAVAPASSGSAVAGAAATLLRAAAVGRAAAATISAASANRQQQHQPNALATLAAVAAAAGTKRPITAVAQANHNTSLSKMARVDIAGPAGSAADPYRINTRPPLQPPASQASALAAAAHAALSAVAARRQHQPTAVQVQLTAPNAPPAVARTPSRMPPSIQPVTRQAVMSAPASSTSRGAPVPSRGIATYAAPARITPVRPAMASSVKPAGWQQVQQEGAGSLIRALLRHS